MWFRTNLSRKHVCCSDKARWSPILSHHAIGVWARHNEMFANIVLSFALTVCCCVFFFNHFNHSGWRPYAPYREIVRHQAVWIRICNIVIIIQRPTVYMENSLFYYLWRKTHPFIYFHFSFQFLFILFIARPESERLSFLRFIFLAWPINKLANPFYNFTIDSWFEIAHVSSLRDGDDES